LKLIYLSFCQILKLCYLFYREEWFWWQRYRQIWYRKITKGGEGKYLIPIC